MFFFSQNPAFFVIPSACPVIFFFPFFFDHVALILHSAYNGDLTYCSCWLTQLQRYLLKGPVILWRALLVISITPFYFLYTHAPVLFLIPVCVEGCRCYYRFFFFCYRRCLPFSVQAGLQIFTYLCDFCFVFFVLWVYFQKPLYLKLSVFLLTLVLVSVTRVLALCKDGSKQMSDLPFLFFKLKNKLWHTELMTQNSISNAWAICRGWTVNFCWEGSDVI